MQFDEAIQKLKAHEADLRQMGVKSLYMFGSTVRGEQTPQSDVDLFFDYERGTLGLGLIDIKEAASRILGCRTDIMTRGSLNQDIRPYAEAEAVHIF
jgi:predicted nucleotidyltransferase